MEPVDRDRAVVTTVLAWYAGAARDLPWRAPDRTAWGVLVSEIMLAQTPVERVRPAWDAWLTRWPDAAALAGATTADVIRQWGRLGYPRRALQLQEAAVACVDRHGGAVPQTYDELRALPGVGDYTAAAVLAFAYGRRAVVLDTNVRRVLARQRDGRERPGPSITVAERAAAATVLPAEPARAALWSAAVMELGALVCTARSPACESCPVAGCCAWRAAGQPAYDGPARRVQRFTGTDRQVRGRLMAVLREARGSVAPARLDAVWPDAAQRARALDSLVVDGLVDPLSDGTYALPE